MSEATELTKTNPNLFYVGGEAVGAPGLKGTLCADCGAFALLSVPVCPSCLSRKVSAVCIGAKATLTRFSTVHHSADSFDAPYVIGQIRTAEGPMTFAPIVDADAAVLKEGMALRFRLLDRGAGLVGFAYVVDTP